MYAIATLLLILSNTPMSAECGVMSWYGPGFHGDSTACGEIYDMNQISVAHKTLPMGTEVVFYYNGNSERAVVNDRGPYVPGRDWDASRRLAKRLWRGDFHRGVLPVQYHLTGNRVIRPTMLYNM
jgi:rare lipoprotein A